MRIDDPERQRPVVGLSVPKQSTQDVFYELAKSVVGMVPVVGSPVSATFGMLLSKPLEKKRDHFLESVASQLVRLRQDVNDIQGIINDPSFVASLPSGVSIALQTNSTTKLAHTRNGVINAAVLSPSEDKRLKFFNALQNLGPIHLAVLHCLNDPYSFDPLTKSKLVPLLINGIITVYLKDIFSQYDEDFLNIIVADLHSNSLISQEKNSITLNPAHAHHNILTSYGKEFLAFTANPLKVQDRAALL